MGTNREAYGVRTGLVSVRAAEVAATWIDAAHQLISRGTASPVLVTDEFWRIVALNPEAERLLGFSSNEAEGRQCQTLLHGLDRFGNHLPRAQCDVASMARRGEPVHPVEFDVVTAVGDVIRAACSMIVLQEGAVCRIVHILTPIPSAARRNEARSTPSGDDLQARSGGAMAARRFALTAREYEVLRMLAKGSDCHQIAASLFISLPTVRNHVHNFLRKLDVHSQVEAVALAYREDLI